MGLEAMGGARCRTCAEPGEFSDARCPRCALRPPPFEQAIAPYHHEGPLARAIHRFKYEDHPELARPLGALLAEAVADVFGSTSHRRGNHPERSPPNHPERSGAESRGPRIDEPPASAFSLCAIPLHKSRYAQRLYDQAELLTSELSKKLKFPHLGALERVRATSRQVGLSEAARELNVRDAFRAVADVKGKDLLLVDDVLTTGATARAAAGALKEAGANRVVLLTLARAATEPE